MGNQMIQYKQAFDQYLADHAFASKAPNKLYQPIDYIMNLGGKRLRPIASLMACDLFAGDFKKALPISYALEIFHNFSLVHDDIMDQSSLRRGKDTVHKKWDENTAILSGDVMLIYAYEHLLKTGSNHLQSLIQIFNEVSIGVCEGQRMDMDFEDQEIQDIAIDEYIKMIELKTSILIWGAFKMGALIADATNGDMDNIAEFGRKLGIAFQLQDDYLDTFGQRAKVGKRIGGDILQNKKTFLVLKTYELADQADKNRLNTLLSTPIDTSEEEQKINEVTQLFLKYKVDKLSRDLIKAYSSESLEHLYAIKNMVGSLDVFEQLQSNLMHREK